MLKCLLVERLKRIGFVLESLISPFGATVVNPWPGTRARFKNISEGPTSARTRKGRGRRIIIPTGSTAEITFKQNGQSVKFTVSDYRERPGHTAGAKVAGGLMEFTLNSENRKVEIPGLATFTYKRKLAP